MPSIHFLCPNRINLHRVSGSTYDSGDWALSPADAARVVGGMLYLHQTKAERSYYGGRVESFREIETDRPGAKRIVFRFTFAEEGRGAEWRKAAHAIPSSSGVLED